MAAAESIDGDTPAQLAITFYPRRRDGSAAPHGPTGRRSGRYRRRSTLPLGCPAAPASATPAFPIGLRRDRTAISRLPASGVYRIVHGSCPAPGKKVGTGHRSLLSTAAMED